MAALLRQGARRIGGSVLQRTQAALASPAVAGERRRLVPRRLYSTEEQAQDELHRKINQKKEELYDVICKAEQSFWTSSFRNKRLLQHLSVRVKPRPEDFKWRFLRFSQRAINVVEAAGLVALTSVLISVVLRLKRFADDRHIVRAMILKERQREAETRRGPIENQSYARSSEN